MNQAVAGGGGHGAVAAAGACNSRPWRPHPPAGQLKEGIASVKVLGSGEVDGCRARMSAELSLSAATRCWCSRGIRAPRRPPAANDALLIVNAAYLVTSTQPRCVAAASMAKQVAVAMNVATG